MKLPKANLITAINGGAGALRQMLKDNAKEEFNGYIKATMRAGLVPANGVVVLVQGRPVVAFFHHVDKQFGKDALPEIFKISCETSCVMKIYSFPKEVNDEITVLVNEFSNAKVDMDSFWNEVDSGHIKPGMFPEKQEATGSSASAAAGQAGTGGAAGHGTVPAVPSPQPLSSGVRGILNETGGDLKMVVGEGLDIVGGTQGRTIDIQEVKKQLQDKEEAIRKEIDSKIEERAMLKQEEEQFLKMDENLQRVMKGKEDEIAERDRIIADLKTKQEGQPPISASEADEKLLKERESLKQREAKLQEMERMFRRVLTNTEERLKSKEEELLAKEEELKRQVDERNKFLEDLRAREAKVKEIEIRMAGSDSSANIQKLYETELRLRKVEEELMAKRNALEAAERKMGEHESIKGEVKAVLGMMDILLGRLPQEHIATFAKSEAHATYKRVMDHFKAGESKGDPNVKGLLERAMAVAPVPSGVPPPPWSGEKVTEAEVRKTGADVDALVKAQEINEKRQRDMDAALKLKESKLQESRDRIKDLEDKARQFVDERKALLRDSEEMRKTTKQMESVESKAKMMEDELEGLREKARKLESRENELLREKQDMDIQLKRLQEDSATEEDMDGLEKAEAELRKEVEELKAKEAETKKREAELTAQLDSKIKELAESEKAMDELEDEVEEKVAAIDGLKKELKGKPALEADAKRLEDELAKAKAEMTKASDAEKSLRDEIEKKAEQVKALEARLEEELKAGAAEEAGTGAGAAGAATEGPPPADDELLKMLKILDDLLGKLPEDVVEEFVKTAHYELYERIFEKYKL